MLCLQGKYKIRDDIHKCVNYVIGCALCVLCCARTQRHNNLLGNPLLSLGRDVFRLLFVMSFVHRIYLHMAHKLVVRSTLARSRSYLM